MIEGFVGAPETGGVSQPKKTQLTLPFMRQ
jgi:hypothetical protein